MARFFSLDVETANANMESICQIGIVQFDNETVADTWQTLINPQDYFDPINTRIHGITPEKIAYALTFEQIHADLQTRIKNQIVVTHTAFDRTALRRACKKNNLPLIECKWLDSASVVRKHWQQFAQSGFGLENIAAHLGIDYLAHDAAEDARAAGLVLLAAMKESGISLEEWQELTKPVSKYAPQIKLDGHPEGLLYGENIVFTGELTIPRPQAAQLAAEAGCNVQTGVTRQTTLVVVGIQDRNRLTEGQNKSSKHRKAEQLMQQGQPLRIIAEKDFFDLIDYEPEEKLDDDDGIIFEFRFG